MIKWPEPAGYIRKDQLQKVQQGWAYLCDVGPEPRADKQPIHTEAQLKQAVRDALNLAADTCESTLYVEGDGAVSVFGPKTDANVEIRKCRDAIHTIIAAINAKESK